MRSLRGTDSASYRQVNRKAAANAIAGFTLLIAQVAVADDDQSARLCRGPYLQCATPESIVVVWRTNAAARPRVRLGLAPGELDIEVSGDDVLVRTSMDVAPRNSDLLLYQEPQAEASQRDPRDPDPSTPPGTWQFEAHITGLQAATRYYYAVYDGERRLAGGDQQHFFITSPAPGSDADMRIWVVGDSGTGERDQREVHEAMQQYVEQTDRRADLYLHVGDMAYGDGTDPEFQRNFFDVYQTTLRNTVCWPTMGNHEGHTSRGMFGFGPYYDAYVVPTAAEAGGVPSGSEAYYSFDVADAHFVCLDSHDLDRRPDGAMAQWLVADLEQTRADWLIAFWHHPPYTKGSHDSDREGQLIEMRTHIMPLLEACGVDLVMSGHSHIYERSVLIDGAYDTPTTADGVILDDGDGRPDGDGAYRKSKGLKPHEGTVAIVSGHGGAGLSRKGTMPVMREIIVAHGSVLLDIQGDTLTGTMIDKAGAERDQFVIVKQGEAHPSIVANPWQPVEDPSQITEVTVAWDQEEVGASPRRWQVARDGGGSWKVELRSDPRELRQAAVEAGGDAFLAFFEEFNGEVNEMECWMEVAKNSAPTATAGLALGIEDDHNYFSFRLNPDQGAAELWRMRDGSEELVTRKQLSIDLAGPVKVELEPVGSIIEVQLQDEVEYTLNLDAPLPAGSVGVYVGPGGRANYALFTIEKRRP